MIQLRVYGNQKEVAKMGVDVVGKGRGQGDHLGLHCSAADESFPVRSREVLVRGLFTQMQFWLVSCVCSTPLENPVLHTSY